MSTIIGRSPFNTAFSSTAEDSGLSTLMRRMLYEPFFGTMEHAPSRWSPAVGSCETNDARVITAELPGLSQNEIALSAENNVLTISGEKDVERTDTASAARFYVAEHVKAEFSKGILSISLPTLPQAKGRVLPVAAM